MRRRSLLLLALRSGPALVASVLAATPASACGCGELVEERVAYAEQLASLGPLWLLLGGLLALALASYAVLRRGHSRHARSLLVATLLSAAIVSSYTLAYRLTLLVVRRGDVLDREALFYQLLAYSAVLLALLSAVLLGVIAHLAGRVLAGKWYIVTAIATPTLWSALGLIGAVVVFQLLNLRSEHALYLSWWASALGLGTLMSYRRALAA